MFPTWGGVVAIGGWFSVDEAVYDILEKKALADEVDARRGSHRESMVEFFEGYFMQKYGMGKVRGRFAEGSRKVR